MRWKHHILAVAVLALISQGFLLAEAPGPAAESQAQNEADQSPVFGDLTARGDEESIFLIRGQSPYDRRELAMRFGWWATDTQGNLTKINEFQRVESSPFFDVDGLSTDGDRTFDFTITGTDNEGASADFYFYRPGLSADVGYQRFYRRLDQDPLAIFRDDGSGSYDLTSTDTVTSPDMAIRVQELHANFKGRLTDNISWRLNLWGMKKKGERHVRAHDHNCFSSECHISSQEQRIDWLTMEIEPVIEATFGAVTAEYSRTMRSFNQSDSITSRDYSTFPGSFNPAGGPYAFAVVPENFTQIDRVKLGVDLTESTDFYANLFTGDTKNRTRNVHRDFWGVDVRVNNQSIDGLLLTGYAKRTVQDNQTPTEFLGADEGEVDVDDVRHPVNYTRTQAGIKGRWRPFRRQFTSSGPSLTAGYEYRTIDRQFAIWPRTAGRGDPAIDILVQPTTVSNVLHAGIQHRWSPVVDTHIRFETRSTDNPLIGMREFDENSLDTATNTNLAEHADLVEFGGTWTPTYNFLLSASIGIENRHHSSNYADFDEDDYPLVVTAWYAPTPRWSFSAGFAEYTNWINQDITLGIDHRADTPIVRPRFNYGGRADVVNLGTSFAYSEAITLTGTVEFVRSRNVFDEPPGEPAPGDWDTLASFSDVLVETTRVTAGVDYWFRDGMSCYFHYNYFLYDDRADINTGSANMFLAGVSGIY